MSGRPIKRTLRGASLSLSGRKILGTNARLCTECGQVLDSLIMSKSDVTDPRL